MSNEEPVPVGSLWNVPNMVTLARIDLTLCCFICLSLGWYGAGLVFFVIAAGTDWVDGWWARRYNQITQIGRVLDPFADKLLICGVFTYLAATPGSDVAPWMAVVVLGRELLVTALRSFVESSGGDFSAKQLGKLKMGWQCVAASLSLLQVSGWIGARLPGPSLLWNPDSVSIVDISIWISLVFTVWSGIDYLFRVASFVQENASEEH